MFKSLSQQTIVYGLSGVLGRSASLLLVPLYLQFLSPTDYGVLAIISVTTSFLLALLQLSMKSAVFRFYLDADTDKEKILISSTAFFLVVGISVAVLGVLGMNADILATILLDASAFSLLFQLAFVRLLLSNIQAIPLALFRARGQAIRYVFVSLVGLVVSLLSSVFLVAVLQMGLTGVMLGTLIGAVVATLITLPEIIKSIHFTFSVNLSKRLLRFAIPLVFGAVPVMLIDMIDRYFLNWLSTTEQVGIYTLGYKFGMMTKLFLVVPFALAWAPFAISIKDRSNARQTYQLAMIYFLLIGTALTLFISLPSRYVITWLAPEEFYSAWTVVPLVSVAYVVYGTFVILNVGVYLTRDTKFVTYSALAGLGINVGLCLFLIPMWGMMGAAWATVMAYLTMSLLMWRFSRRLYPLSFDGWRIFKILVLGLVTYGIGSVLPSTNNRWIDIGIQVIVASMYPIMLWIGGFFKDAEKTAIRGAVWAIMQRLRLVAN
ncbi:MAG: oligosaccharide flippase family protein [Planctomycetes bacterium]|nr:oligosaccharide flippase family protein [Planctomycetota bacterium]